MDSLLANYASSDEEVEERQQPQTTNYNKPSSSSSSSSSIFTSLPPPKSSSSSSSSLFNSLPPPKSNPTQTLRNPQSPKHINQFQHQQQEDDSEVNHNQSSSVFSSLPPPKTYHSDSNLSSSFSDPKPKKIVQFKPPINTVFIKSRDVDSSEDDDDDDKEEKQRKRSKEFTQTSSVKSFLSAIPAPKNSVALGALSSSGSGRRSIIEADVPASIYNDVNTENEVNKVIVNSNAENYEGQWVEGMEAAAGSSDYDAVGGGDPSYWAPTSENSLYYESNSNNENYGHCGQQYESKWIDKSEATSAPEISGMTESVFKIPGKRGRNDIPQDMVEVKQDELIKNRPREDQVKLTGIAFGPSYQPASSKGKPTKLHKRKHQIGSLYFDMRQKEMELAERRAKGFLTKSETQAKYGW